MKSAKKKKVQPSIASFLFSKSKQPAVSKPDQPKRAVLESDVLSEVQASKFHADSSEPPHKKQRTGSASTTGLVLTPGAAKNSSEGSAASRASLEAAATPQETPMPMASQPLQPIASGADDMEVEVMPPQHDAAATIPLRQDARHSRLQHKLVENEGRRSRKSDAPGEPGKFTPLELQVNELRKRYPDVLLIIEVGNTCSNEMVNGMPNTAEAARFGAC